MVAEEPSEAHVDRGGSERRNVRESDGEKQTASERRWHLQLRLAVRLARRRFRCSHRFGSMPKKERKPGRLDLHFRIRNRDLWPVSLIPVHNLFNIDKDNYCPCTQFIYGLSVDNS